MVDKNGEKTKIKLDENFPKRFRYRNMEYLKNDIYIHKYEEIINNEIKDKKIETGDDNDINDNENKIITLSTEENSINELNI